MLMIYNKQHFFPHRLMNWVFFRWARYFLSNTAKAEVKMIACHDELSLHSLVIDFLQSTLIYVPVLLQLWSLCILQWTVKKTGPVKTHGWLAQISTISSLQQSLVQLFVHKRIMNDSAWWMEGCGKVQILVSKRWPINWEHYLLKTQTKQSINHQNNQPGLTSGWVMRQMTIHK